MIDCILFRGEKEEEEVEERRTPGSLLVAVSGLLPPVLAPVLRLTLLLLVLLPLTPPVLTSPLSLASSDSPLLPILPQPPSVRPLAP